MDQAGLRPSDAGTPEGFRRLPITEKADYRRNFPQGVIAMGKTLRERLTLKSQSSGTGGERLTTITHTYELAKRMWVTLGAHEPLREALKRIRRQRPLRYAAPNCSDVECATPFSTPKDRTLADGTLVLPVSHDLLATPERLIVQAIEETKAFKPHWFYADATHLAFLIRNMRRHGVPPPDVSAIALTYTLATGVARRQIREFFGTAVPTTEILSMSELGWLAVQCPAGQMHINNVTFFTEFLVDGRFAEPGEFGELVVTSVGDRLLPHMRYRTGDVYRISEGGCACGSDLPLARHEGRCQNMIAVRRGGRREWVGPRDIDAAVGDDLPIDVYQLHQFADDSCLFRYIPSREMDRRPDAALRERLADVLGDGSRPDVEEVAYIPSQRSGKFTSCTSEIAERLGSSVLSEMAAGVKMRG
ncbi:hypothetical protein [Spongiactinospora sp. 9N601]|uniref:hypothetical protein n=1 Tax=Spongiactinospora sp. 9N601 TaxID=3375149 RepID=UPI00378A4319